MQPTPISTQQHTRYSGSALHEAADAVNGDKQHSHLFDELPDLPLNATAESLPTAPALTYEKFLTMQDKRVVVTIRYSGESGLRPYFLTVAKKLKQSHPDVLVERRILPAVPSSSSDGMEGEATFEILVDGTVVVGRTKARRAKVARVDMSKSRSVFVSMQELDFAITRARRRRRPSTTVYGDKEATIGGVRKEMLRGSGGDD
jgi:hypothetical protein